MAVKSKAYDYAAESCPIRCLKEMSPLILVTIPMTDFWTRAFVVLGSITALWIIIAFLMDHVRISFH